MFSNSVSTLPDVLVLIVAPIVVLCLIALVHLEKQAQKLRDEIRKISERPKQ